MRLIAFPQGGSTSFCHILALIKPMGVFLWIFILIIILKRAIVYQPLSLVFCFPLKAGPTSTAVSVWLALGMGIWMLSIAPSRVPLHWNAGLLGTLPGDGCTSKPSKLWWPFGWSSALCSLQAAWPQLSSLTHHGRVVPAHRPMQRWDRALTAWKSWIFLLPDQAFCQHGACPSWASEVNNHSGYPWAR